MTGAGSWMDVAADLLRATLAEGGKDAPFSDLTADAFAALARGMRLRRADAGAEVIREGDDGASLFVVSAGALDVSRRDDRGERVLLARLGPGEVFGEMALLSGAPRAATVTAREPSQLLELDADALRDLAARHPEVEASLRRFHRRRVLANALALSPIFRPFGPDDRLRVARRFHAVEARAGDVVVREGDPSDGLYVLLDGAVDVVKRRLGSEVVIGQLRGGDLFGEMSCLRKSPATATVRVRRAGTLLRLPRAAFDELVVTHPQILEQLAALAEERKESLDAILAGRAQWTDEGLVLV